MAICKPPRPSSKVGQTSTSCLQKFTIHFRRPDTLSENSNYIYRGEYGFDWLRDEYIYPIEKVDIDYKVYKDPFTGNITTTPILLNRAVPLCKTPGDLLNEYKKDIKNSITPYGIDYYPAWLSIFACNVEGAGSTIHQDGINLTLQLDEIDTIIDDGTEIIFEPSKPCLKITPNKISISHFLQTPKKPRSLDNNAHTLKINYYQLDNAINIKCFGDTLKEHEEIKVFAKQGPTKVEVGKLMVYKNDNIGKAKIVVVNVITEYDKKGNKIYPQAHKSLDDLYNCHSFNQAMIRTEVILGEELDLVKLSNVESNYDVRSFLHDINDESFIENKEKAHTLTNRLRDLYDNYGKNLPEGGKVDEDGHFNTYLLLTTLSPTKKDDFKGLATAKFKKSVENGKVWKFGNIVGIFEKGLNDDHTLVHEVAHSFSLRHLLLTADNKFHFHAGYTENYMDNFSFDGVNPFADSPKYINKDNRYKGKMYSFYKWQWDFMFNDRSIEKNK